MFQARMGRRETIHCCQRLPVSGTKVTEKSFFSLWESLRVFN
jgi:hypothetical protein